MSQETISVHGLSDAVNEYYGEVVSHVLGSDTIALTGGEVIVVRLSPDEKTCSLESWTVTPEYFFVKTMRTVAQATRREAIDSICKQVPVSIITVEEFASLDSTVSSVEHFRLMGWNLNTHYNEIMTDLKHDLLKYYMKVVENGNEGIEKAILSLAPGLR